MYDEGSSMNDILSQYHLSRTFCQSTTTKKNVMGKLTPICGFLQDLWVGTVEPAPMFTSITRLPPHFLKVPIAIVHFLWSISCIIRPCGQVTTSNVYVLYYKLTCRHPWPTQGGKTPNGFSSGLLDTTLWP